MKLLKDVDISETVIVAKAVKLDLNGKTISNTNDLWEKRAADWSLLSVRADQIRQRAENQARDRNARGGGKNVESRFHETPPGYGRTRARCECRSAILTGYADGDFGKSGLPGEEKTQFPAPPSAYAPRREAQCFASGLVQEHGRFLTGLRAGARGNSGRRSVRSAKEASKRG